MRNRRRGAKRAHPTFGPLFNQSSHLERDATQRERQRAKELFPFHFFLERLLRSRSHLVAQPHIAALAGQHFCPPNHELFFKTVTEREKKTSLVGLLSQLNKIYFLPLRVRP